jgi:hypothetical protein
MPSNEARPLAIPPELDAEMTPAVRAFVGLLLDRIAKLEARVEELERGRKTPQNSSLPPSTVHPHAKPPATQRKSKKKRGGQRGHKKHERPLLPTEECDAAAKSSPAAIVSRCGTKCGNCLRSRPT